MTAKSDPASTAIVVTASDTTVLKPGCRALYIGVAGNVAIETIEDGTAVTFVAVPVGILPVGAVRVLGTGTTATSIIAIY